MIYGHVTRMVMSTLILISNLLLAKMMSQQNDFKQRLYSQVQATKEKHETENEYESSQSEYHPPLPETKPNMPVPHDTICRFMDCPDLPKQPVKSSSFKISGHEWNKIQPNTEKLNTLRPPWTDIMARQMKESNEFCMFQFQRHYMMKKNLRKLNTPIVFCAKSKCIFEDCSCTFKLGMKRDDFVEKKITVLYNGSVKHAAGERQSRFIQNDERK